MSEQTRREFFKKGGTVALGGVVAAATAPGLAGAAGLFLGFLGTVFSYFKLDTATRGYYSGRLKLAAGTARAVVRCVATYGARPSALRDGRWISIRLAR